MLLAAIGAGLLSAVLLWGVLVWQLVLRRCGLAVPFRPLARAWFLSNLSRYIPGVVWQFVTLAQLGPGVGLTPAVTVMSLLVQMGFLLLAAGALGVWLLPLQPGGDAGAAVAGAALDGAAGAAGRASAGDPRRTGGGGAGDEARHARLGGSWLDGIAFLLISAGSWLLYGAAFFLFLRSFVDLPASAFGAIAAINALAFIVGYVVVIAPGGAGFKEGALALLLTGLLPAGVAASLAVLSRLWSIAGEVLPALLLAARRPPGGAPVAASAAALAGDGDGVVGGLDGELHRGVQHPHDA